MVSKRVGESASGRARNSHSPTRSLAHSHTDVPHDEARRLIDSGSVRLLDVRTSEEYQHLGHVPGAMLLPVQLIPSGLATLPREGAPLLVYCEHGQRSTYAAEFLAKAGYRDVLNLTGGMSCWTGPRDFSSGNPFASLGPSSWLIENADLLPSGGRALDLACGTGRHAFLLASAGFSVHAVDRDTEKIEAIRLLADRMGFPLNAEVVDLELGDADLGTQQYDLIVAVHYLHRPLFPALVRSLCPGGILLYETFTIHQAKRGKPTNPAFLLQPGELPELARPLEVLRRREGDFDGRMVAGVVARRVN